MDKFTATNDTSITSPERDLCKSPNKRGSSDRHGSIVSAQLISAGTILLPLRLITGWTYFSAFWRRVVLEDKLDPDSVGYIGEKFNHFLPNALFIKPLIEFFVSNPDLLWWKLVIFTIVEGIVGACLMLGFMTRLMGIATSLLALGILLGAGWLGTTCLDEWQIGILGLGAGAAFAWSGGGAISIDRILSNKLSMPIGRIKAFLFMPDLMGHSNTTKCILTFSVLAFGLTLYTNQVFHGGVWGELKNLSVKPHVNISNAVMMGDELSMELYRTEGADVYGAFVIEIRVLDEFDNALATWTGKELSKLENDSISNRFVAKIQPGKHSLVLPLGAKGTIILRHPALSEPNSSKLRVMLVDVSGATWEADIQT